MYYRDFNNRYFRVQYRLHFTEMNDYFGNENHSIIWELSISYIGIVETIINIYKLFENPMYLHDFKIYDKR